MALRPVSDLGLVDPTTVPVRGDEGAPEPVQVPSAVSVASGPGAPEGPSRPRRARGKRVSTARQPASAEPSRPSVPLADEPTRFLQIMVAGELRDRLARASFQLEPAHPRLHHQKTIIAALIWRYVKPDDAEPLAELSTLLDQFENDDLVDVPGQVKVGANVPASLKRRLDGAVLALRSRHRRVSGKSILSALVARYVDPVDVTELGELLVNYEAAARPRRAEQAAA